MRQHRLSLCQDHYPLWMQQQVEQFIEKYQMFSRQERILLAVSGGKDSLSLWDILWRLNYPVEGLHLNLGIQGFSQYSEGSQYLVEQFAEKRNLNLHTINMKKTQGETIPEIAARTQRGRSRPCAVCGLIKRHHMNHFASQHGFDVLVTAHNLDDQIAFLFGSILDWDLSGCYRQYPLLPAKDGLLRKAKPLFRATERELTAYAIVGSIDYIQNECPFSEGSKQIQYKQLFNLLEDEQPGVKIRFMTKFLSERRDPYFSSIINGDNQEPLNQCQICGQPTTSSQLCAFCRLFNGNHS